MGLRIVPLVIVITYLLVMLAVGFFVNKLKIRDSTDYMLAGRRMGLFFAASSLSVNNIGEGGTMGLAAKAFSGWGMSAAWYILAASVAMIPLAYFAPRIRKTMAFTIPEVVGRRFGIAAGTFTAALNVISLFLLTSSQILAAGSVVNSLTGLPLNASILLAGLAVIFYTTMGGMLADAITDMIQYALILFGLLVALPFVIGGAGGWSAVAAKLPPADLSVTKIGWVTIIGLVLNYFCTFLSGPETVSRFYSASDEKTARRASLLCAFMMALLAFVPTLMGLAALAMKPGLDAGKGTTALMFVTASFAPSFITGIVAAAIIAAAMSGADSNLLSASTILIMDICRKFFKPKIDDRKVIRYTRVCNVMICLACMGVALFNINLVTLNLFAFALRSAGPFAAYGLGLTVRNATKNAGIASIVTGSAAVVVWQLLKEPFGILAIVFGCFAGTLTFFIVSAAERRMGKPPAPSAYVGD